MNGLVCAVGLIVLLALLAMEFDGERLFAGIVRRFLCVVSFGSIQLGESADADWMITLTVAIAGAISLAILSAWAR